MTASSASVTMCPRVTPDHKSGKHQIYKSTQVTRCGAQVHKSSNHQEQKYALETAIGQTSKNRRPITAQCFVHSHRAKNKTREEQTPNMIVRSHRASCCQFRDLKQIYSHPGSIKQLCISQEVHHDQAIMQLCQEVF